MVAEQGALVQSGSDVRLTVRPGGILLFGAAARLLGPVFIVSLGLWAGAASFVAFGLCLGVPFTGLGVLEFRSRAIADSHGIVVRNRLRRTTHEWRSVVSVEIVERGWIAKRRMIELGAAGGPLVIVASERSNSDWSLGAPIPDFLVQLRQRLLVMKAHAVGDGED
jgi:hypothetical protein